MRILVLVTLASLALFSCGSGGSTTPKKKNDPSKDPPKDQKNCPTSVASNVHEITVTFTKPVPARLGLKLDGDFDVRVSECSAKDQAGPYAILQKSDKTVKITVDHRNAFSTLPQEAHFELFDMGNNCTGTPATFYKQTGGLNITWKLEYPNGRECASRAYGVASITPIGMEEAE